MGPTLPSEPPATGSRRAKPAAPHAFRLRTHGALRLPHVDGARAVARLYSPAPMSITDNPTVPLRAALVAVQLPDVDDDAFAASLAELRRLGRTLGVAGRRHA